MNYYVLAHYSNFVTGEKTNRTICYAGMEFDSETECNLYAMECACDLTEEDERLDGIEFIDCCGHSK